MTENTKVLPFHQGDPIDDPPTGLAREGARRMLAEALKAEADAFVASFEDDRLRDVECGRTWSGGTSTRIMRWTAPLQRHRCAKVVVVIDHEEPGAVHEQG